MYLDKPKIKKNLHKTNIVKRLVDLVEPYNKGFFLSILFLSINIK